VDNIGATRGKVEIVEVTTVVEPHFDTTKVVECEPVPSAGRAAVGAEHQRASLVVAQPARCRVEARFAR